MLFLIPFALEAAEGAEALIAAVEMAQAAGAATAATTTATAATATAATATATAATVGAAEAAAGAATVAATAGAAEAAAGAAGAGAAEAGASATARSAAGHLFSAEGRAALMNNIKTGIHEMTSKVAGETGLWNKLNAVVDTPVGHLASSATKWGVAGKAAVMGASALGVAAVSTEFGQHLMAHVFDKATGVVHGAGVEHMSEHDRKNIESFAERAAKYGTADALSKDTQAASREVLLDGADLRDTLRDITLALEMARSSPEHGLPGLSGKVDATEAKITAFRWVDEEQQKLVTSGGRLTHDQLAEVKDKLSQAMQVTDGKSHDMLGKALDTFQKLGPSPDAHQTTAAVTQLGTARESLKHDVAESAAQISVDLARASGRHLEQLEESVNKLMPKIVEANAKYIDRAATQASQPAPEVLHAQAQRPAPAPERLVLPSQVEMSR
jgi:hypothetical protein